MDLSTNLGKLLLLATSAPLSTDSDAWYFCCCCCVGCCTMDTPLLGCCGEAGVGLRMWAWPCLILVEGGGGGSSGNADLVSFLLGSEGAAGTENVTVLDVWA